MKYLIGGKDSGGITILKKKKKRPISIELPVKSMASIGTLVFPWIRHLEDRAAQKAVPRFNCSITLEKLWRGCLRRAIIEVATPQFRCFIDFDGKLVKNSRSHGKRNIIR